jgi:hypothetical protein
MDKYSVVYPYHGKLFTSEKEGTIDIDIRTWMRLKDIM